MMKTNVLGLLALLAVANSAAAEVQTVKHRITGLFNREREADLRELVKKLEDVSVVAVDFDSAEVTFSYDPAKLFPRIKEKDWQERFDQLLRQNSRHTFGAKPLSTVPKDKLTRLVAAAERELREAALRAERRKMQERLFTADRMVSVGTLAAGVAHEINSPLATVILGLEISIERLAQLGAAAGAESVASQLREIEANLRDVHEASERVCRIAQDLRSFSWAGSDDPRGPELERRLGGTGTAGPAGATAPAQPQVPTPVPISP